MKNIISLISISVLLWCGSGTANPAYKVEHVRPSKVDWALGAMDFMSGGRMVVTNWSDPYCVYIIDGIEGSPDQMKVTEYASGFREILGMSVVNDSIYVCSKDNIMLLLDHDKDGKADEYRIIAYDWSRTTNEKNYAFGMPWSGEHFYLSFNGDLTGGATLRVPQPPGRQNITWQISKTGEMKMFAGGHRVPAGVEFVYGELWVTENQGGYRPSSPLINVREGRWYGRQVETKPLRFLQPYPKKGVTPRGDYSPFAAEFIFKETARSPGNPAGIFEGVYAGQLLVPDADICGERGTGGIRRVFLEKVQGELQGCVFHFKLKGEFEGKGVWKLKWSPDGKLYAGANASKCAGWGRVTPKGLDRLTYTGNIPFEMLAVRSLGKQSFEIEFTEKLQAPAGTDLKGDLTVESYWNELQDKYGGGGKKDHIKMSVNSAMVSADGKKVVVEMDDIQELRIYYFEWGGIKSESGADLFESEAWYSLLKYGPGQDNKPLAGCPDPRYAEYMPIRDVDDQSLCAVMNVEKPVYNFNHGVIKRIEGGVRISWPDGGAWSINLMDVQGRIINAQRTGGQAETILSTEALAPGIYFIRLMGESQEYMKKLMIMK